jgi:hypothetical protein
MRCRSSGSVDRGTVSDLNQIAIDVSRREDRDVTLSEVIRRLMAAWQQQAQTPRRRA